MKNFCEFITKDNKTFKCMNCGLTIEALEVQMEMPIFICGKQSADKNSALMCSSEQIEHRYTICSSCEFFKDETCTKCGCPLNRRMVYSNKLSQKNESCPVGRWSKID